MIRHHWLQYILRSLDMSILQALGELSGQKQEHQASAGQEIAFRTRRQEPLADRQDPGEDQAGIVVYSPQQKKLISRGYSSGSCVRNGTRYLNV